MFIHFTTNYGSNVAYNADKIRHILQSDRRIYIQSKADEDHYDFDSEATAKDVFCSILAQLKEA